jgi:multiple sugar transport system permease protein
MKKLPLGLSQREALWAYAFLALPLAFFLFIRIWPALQAFQISFYQWHADPSQRQFIGLANYWRMFHDPRFLQALRNTLFYTLLGVPAEVTFALAIALLLNSVGKRFRALFRAIYFAPYVTPPVAVAWTWFMLLNPHRGVVNRVLVALGLPPQPFLSDPATALPTVTAVVVWQFLGFHVLIFLAGLQNIPQMYYEAAQIDGAHGWRLFRYITLPLLKPMIAVSVLMATAGPSIGFLQLFTHVINLTWQNPGGPLGSTLTVLLYMYERAFGAFEMGYGAAIVVFLFFILALISLIEFKVLGRKVEYR